MNNFAIIVAGGSGTRMNATVPKQFMILSARPVLMHSIESFFRFDSALPILVVLPKSEIENWKKLCGEYSFDVEHEIVAGGETRFHSVQNGLGRLNGNGLVAIHDGVRPFLSLRLLETVFAEAAKNGSAVPVLSLNESIRELIPGGSKPAVRSRFMSVQTPQCFDLAKIRAAYQTEYRKEFTDDACVFEFAGNKLHTVEGTRENIKITWPSDLLLAESLMKTR